VAWLYLLFQRREQLERPHAQRFIQVWGERWGAEAGCDEERAHQAPDAVYLVGGA
jgi:hypothetical protein